MKDPPRSRMMNRNDRSWTVLPIWLYRGTVIFSCLALLTFLLPLSSSGAGHEAPHREEALSETTRPERSWLATLIPRNYKHLAARNSGTVRSFAKKEGEKFAKGELLFELVDDRFQLELERAQALVELATAQHAEAELDFKTMQDLFSSEAATVRELRRAETFVATTQARFHEANTRLKLARLDLEECRQTAPFAGLVARVHLQAGEYTRKGEVLIEIMDPVSVLAVVRVKQTDLDLFRTEKKLVLKTALGSRHRGNVETIGVQQDPAAGNVRVTILLSNADGSLWPGGSGWITFEN